MTKWPNMFLIQEINNFCLTYHYFAMGQQKDFTSDHQFFPSKFFLTWRRSKYLHASTYWSCIGLISTKSRVLLTREEWNFESIIKIFSLVNRHFGSGHISQSDSALKCFTERSLRSKYLHQLSGVSTKEKVYASSISRRWRRKSTFRIRSITRCSCAWLSW